MLVHVTRSLPRAEAEPLHPGRREGPAISLYTFFEEIGVTEDPELMGSMTALLRTKGYFLHLEADPKWVTRVERAE